MSSFNDIKYPAESLDDPIFAGKFADILIGGEVHTQDKMWGNANERADVKNCQMLQAAMANIGGVVLAHINGDGQPREDAFAVAEEEFYPDDWSGFRDYGSDIANLAVAAAYIRNEIKRRLMKGESHYRAPRPADKPYTKDQPNQPA